MASGLRLDMTIAGIQIGLLRSLEQERTLLLARLAYFEWPLLPYPDTTTG